MSKKTIAYRAIAGKWRVSVFDEEPQKYIPDDAFLDTAVAEYDTLENCLTAIHRTYLSEDVNVALLHLQSLEKQPINWIERPPWEEFKHMDQELGEYFWVKDEYDHAQIVLVTTNCGDDSNTEAGYCVKELGRINARLPNDFPSWFPVTVKFKDLKTDDAVDVVILINNTQLLSDEIYTFDTAQELKTFNFGLSFADKNLKLTAVSYEVARTLLLDKEIETELFEHINTLLSQNKEKKEGS